MRFTVFPGVHYGTLIDRQTVKGDVILTSDHAELIDKFDTKDVIGRIYTDAELYD